MTMTSIEPARRGLTGNADDPEYDRFMERVNARFRKNIEGGIPLFTTDAEGLFQAYLDAFPAEERQYHTCHCCRHFVERFGGLVTISADGRTEPAIWNPDDAPPIYRASIEALAKMVRRAKVTGVFLSSEPTWGEPRSRAKVGVWTHLHIKPPKELLFKSAVLDAGQRMAERKEEFGIVSRALAEFALPTVNQAVTLLRTDALYRSEKALGQAEWLQSLHVARDAAHGPAKAAVVWRAIATAPSGFCHPRSSMIGTLLEDIAAGMDFDAASKRFAAKMHPLQYQRPQAAPAAGAIAAAEKIVASLGASGALARRFCRLDEVDALWRPKAVPAKTTGGVFGHLVAKAEVHPTMAAPPVTMTWEKFRRTVLSTAAAVEYYVRPGYGPYATLATAVNQYAPPILQWDSEEKRNPVSWYLYTSGSPPAQYGLPSGVYVPVAAVALKPPAWRDGHFPHQGDGVMFLLEGARETKNTSAALFPEILRSEFHGIRSVLEAYSQRAKLEEIDGPHAIGPMLSNGGGDWNARLRVTSGGQVTEYILDRWD